MRRQCHGTNEQVHSSHWHNKEITAISTVYEMRSIIYCTDEKKRREREREDTRTQLKLHVHGSPPPREGHVIFTALNANGQTSTRWKTRLAETQFSVESI